MSAKPDVCFVSSDVYGYLSPDSATSGGGAERQQFLIGKYLNEELNYNISYITNSPRDISHEIIDGMSVWGNLPEPRGLLYSGYRFGKLAEIMKKSNADIYYVRGNHFLCICVAIICKAIGKDYVYAVANDADVEPKHWEEKSSYLKWLYFWSVKNASHVTTLTEYQKDILSNEYGIPPTVIPCGYNLPPKSDIIPASEREYVLWVGRINKDQKHPERYIAIANELPQIDFVMIGPPRDDNEWAADIITRAKETENLSYMGFIPPNEIHEFYRKASILVNTSDYEGFGNVFLEAWRYGTPVISLNYTLDGIISSRDVGIHSGTMENMVNDVCSLHTNDENREYLGLNGRKLVYNQFNISRVARKLSDLFISTA